MNLKERLIRYMETSSVPDWWLKMSSREQQEYLQSHPKSRLRKHAKPTRNAKAPAQKSKTKKVKRPQFSELFDVVRYADKKGVSLDVYEDDKGSIVIDMIERESGRKGSGAHVLKSLCDFADKQNKSIEFRVLGGSHKLIALYQKFGFDFANKRSKLAYKPGVNMRTEPLMVRNPAATRYSSR